MRKNSTPESKGITMLTWPLARDGAKPLYKKQHWSGWLTGSSSDPVNRTTSNIIIYYILTVYNSSSYSTVYSYNDIALHYRQLI